MKSVQSIQEKIYQLDELTRQVSRWKLKNKTIVFTNGVFDILHKGHISSLSQAASLGDILIVGVNSDASVKRLKGPTRPVNEQDARCLLLASMVMTDAVILFEDDTPLNLIKAVMPDVLVKGGDYTVEQIAGAKEVIENGGRVVLADMVDGISTTRIIEKLK
ncbi:MAG: D-glycero-beta-D-manno-heptose 1-phosphate adenylyltransferase [Ferruginibacter sp.]|jgi:rfaE bifunctional protein nucleotidyltransferase chain/domain